MITAYELWHTVQQCTSKHELPDYAWEKLKIIAENMESEDFTVGNKAHIAEKLCNSLGYYDVKAFKKDYATQANIDFLSKVLDVVCQEFDGIQNRLYEDKNGRGIEYNGTIASGQHLKNKFYSVMKEFEFTQRKDENGIKFIDIVFDYQVFDDNIVSRFKEELTKAKAVATISRVREQRRASRAAK